LRQHGFACAWWTDYQHLVPSGGGDHQRTLGKILTNNLIEDFATFFV
jgi:hypothetical protein